MKLLATIMIMLPVFSALVADTNTDSEHCMLNLSSSNEDLFEDNNECNMSRNITELEKQIEEFENDLIVENERYLNKQQAYNLGEFRNLLLHLHPTLCLPENEMENKHIIRLPSTVQQIQVTCDSQYAGPGWIVIQRRIDDDVTFDREYRIYEQGFGDNSESFFIGLEKLHQLLMFSQHELYIYIEHINGSFNFANYDNFKINGPPHYKLTSLGEYSGDAGNLLLGALNDKFLPQKKFASLWITSSAKWWTNSASDSIG